MSATLYALNYIILAIFLSLFVIETGIAMIALLSYKIFDEKIKRYLSTIWEIDITFGIFYLVNFEVTYPQLLVSVGTVYLVPALLAGLFLILRNLFLAYGSYVGKTQNERKYITVYALSTLVIALFLVSILTSSVTGTGITIATNQINIAAIIINPYNILMLISILLISIFVAGMCFGAIRFSRKMYIVLLVALGLFFLATYAFVPYMFSNIVAAPDLIAVSLLLAGVAIFMKVRESKFAGVIAVLWIFVSINLFGITQYPYMFGKNINVTQYLATSAIAGPASIITVVGGLLLGLALAYLAKLSYGSKNNKAKEET